MIALTLLILLTLFLIIGVIVYLVWQYKKDKEDKDKEDEKHRKLFQDKIGKVEKENSDDDKIQKELKAKLDLVEKRRSDDTKAISDLKSRPIPRDFSKGGRFDGDVVVNGKLCVSGTCVDAATFANLLNLTNIQTGSVGADLNCQQGKPQSVSIPVTFNPGYNKVPRVFVALRQIDWCNNNKNLRISASVTNITNKGCNIIITTWHDTAVWRAEANWIAIP
jgi:hypothetical protein